MYQLKVNHRAVRKEHIMCTLVNFKALVIHMYSDNSVDPKIKHVNYVIVKENL